MKNLNLSYNLSNDLSKKVRMMQVHALFVSQNFLSATLNCLDYFLESIFYGSPGSLFGILTS